MKKRLSLLLLMVSSTLLFAGCAAKQTPVSAPSAQAENPAPEGEAVSDTLKKLREQGYITIGSSNDAPLSYVDIETGEYTGIDGEIFKEIMRRLDVPEVKMKQVPFESLLIELNNRSIDIVVDAMYIKPERQEIALFTNVWYTEGDCLLVPSKSEVKTLDDLKGKVVGAQKGTFFLEIANSWKEKGLIKDVTIMGSQSELMLAVNTGKVDACVTDSIIAGYTLTQDSSLDLKLAENYIPDSAGKIGAALRLDDKAFCAELNAVLDGMKLDGSLMKYLEMYGMNESAFVGVEEGQIIQ